MSARSVNKVILIGNLTRDPELRYTPQGTPVCSFGLATNREWVVDGVKKEAADFHNVVSWNKLAELCDQLLAKGSKTYVEGRLQTRDWVDSDGNKRYKTEVVIDEMIVLVSKKSDVGSEEEVMPASQETDVGSDDIDLDEVLSEDFGMDDTEDTTEEETTEEAAE
ncbi:single-stranded DNA-binding protein [Patescibacteria group bacterium]